MVTESCGYVLINFENQDSEPVTIDCILSYDTWIFEPYSDLADGNIPVEDDDECFRIDYLKPRNGKQFHWHFRRKDAGSARKPFKLLYRVSRWGEKGGFLTASLDVF